tara:strand:+ start:1547 stop:1756 length:210 start_codon:yes stop_codon:yes gene_type:complete
MISVYSKWSELEYEAYLSREWDIGDWDWWCDFSCCEFKDEWTYEDLIKSLEEDFVASLSLEEIKVKYLI